MVFRQEKNIFDKGTYFDIILSLGEPASNWEPDFSSMVVLCDNILLPGGTLILTSLSLNHEGWNRCPPGTTWKKSTFGKSIPSHSTEYTLAFEQLGYSIVDSHYFPRSDPFDLTITAQKPAWKPNTRQVISLFNEDAFLFNYILGDEQQLQWDFSGLAPSQELEIWIIASEGADTAAGLGLARALRREYVFWTIRFVSFPSTFGEQLQRQCLQSLPHCLATEPDIIFSPLGEPLVPRLVPLVPPTEVQRKPFELNSLQHTLRPDHIFTHIHRTSIYPDFAAIIASVIQTDLQEYPPGSPVVGLQNNASEGRAVIDAACVTPVDLPVSRTFVDKVPGLVVAFLGPGLSTWKRSRRFGFLRILITHCDTAIGSTISEMYRHEGLEFSQIQQNASMLDLSHMGLERFDLIISGYENRTHVQILRSLCSSTGKLFLWPQELPRFIREDPCSIGDALRLAMSRGFPGTCNSASDPLTFQHAKFDLPLESPPVGAVFDPEKVYVILGGIGSIGAHISLWMAQVSLCILCRSIC